MIVDAIIVGLAFYFTFPLLTGYCAAQYGRSFKVWFAIGCVLPIVSFFILMSMIVWDEKTTPNHKLTRRERDESQQLVDELISSVKDKDISEDHEIEQLLKQRSRLARRQ